MQWKIIPLLVFALLAFFLWRSLKLDPHQLPSAKIGSTLPNFSLPSLASNALISSKDLRGHYVLLNIWASWCPACVQEQIFLLKLARQGVIIYGLDYKDTSKKAQKWLLEWGNPFKEIIFDKHGLLSMDLGVYGAPETFLIDSSGVIQYRHVGILDASIWRKDFLPRIKELT
ncbi:MAG: thiol:disulfide interchange protein [Legionellales bacterium RIFCSPHIGHO2_12_FULL_35_11]|nr:MAG: thiol:disulfide interchange protein [Legionellales bacterium RIFCSPHIGHO2_12_FULL_35_11]